MQIIMNCVVKGGRSIGGTMNSVGVRLVIGIKNIQTDIRRNIALTKIKREKEDIDTEIQKEAGNDCECIKQKTGRL
jgi:hypothetical protein